MACGGNGNGRHAGRCRHRLRVGRVCAGHPDCGRAASDSSTDTGSRAGHDPGNPGHVRSAERNRPAIRNLISAWHRATPRPRKTPLRQPQRTRCLIAHYPGQKSALDDSYAITLATVTDAQVSGRGYRNRQGGRCACTEGWRNRPRNRADPLPAARPGRRLGPYPTAGFRSLYARLSSRGYWSGPTASAPDRRPPLTS